MAERKIFLGDRTRAAKFLPFARKLLRQIKSISLPQKTMSPEDGVYVSVAAHSWVDEIIIRALPVGGGLIFIATTGTGVDTYLWRGRGEASKQVSVADADLSAVPAFLRRLQRFFGSTSTYQFSSIPITADWSVVATATLSVSGPALQAIPVSLPSFYPGNEERDYEFLWTLPDGRQYGYAAINGFSRTGLASYWVSRSITGDGYLRDAIHVPLTEIDGYTGYLYWPARGYDTRDYAEVNHRAIYMRGSGTNDGLGIINQYYEVWRWGLSDGASRRVAQWEGIRDLKKYQFHSFVQDPKAQVWGYVESLYEDDGAIGDTFNVIVGPENDVTSTASTAFSITPGTIEGHTYTRTAGTKERFVRVWAVATGVYGMQIRNGWTSGDPIKDQFFLLSSAGTSLVYEAEATQTMSIIRGGCIPNPNNPKQVIFAENLRTDSENPAGCKTYVLDITTGQSILIADGVIPTDAAWYA